jgi:hypothetical protein
MTRWPLVAASIAVGCSSDPYGEDGCPENAPGVSEIEVTVTEGSSTVFPVYADGAIPDYGAGYGVGVMIDTDDHSIATLSSGVIDLEPPSDPGDAHGVWRRRWQRRW